MVSVVLIESEKTFACSISILLNKGQYHIRHNHFHLSFIKSAVFGFGAVVNKSILTETSGIIKVNRVYAHQAEGEDETIFSKVKATCTFCPFMGILVGHIPNFLDLLRLDSSLSGSFLPWYLEIFKRCMRDAY